MATPDTPDTTDAGVRDESRTRRTQEKLDIERRRRVVGQLRFVDGLAEATIVERLAKLTPPIIVSRVTVTKDVAICRTKFRQYYNSTGFDAPGEIGIAFARYERVIRMAQNGARRAIKDKDGKTLALLLRTVTHAIKESTDLMQSCGLVDKRIGTLMIGDASGRKAERLPGGEELAKLFERIDTKVIEGELVSEAEQAWLYGDAVAALNAANAATDSTRDERPTTDDER